MSADQYFIGHHGSLTQVAATEADVHSGSSHDSMHVEHS